MRGAYVIAFHQLFCSMLFSKPVCRYPTTAASPTTSSPCRSTTSRSTPCVDGWFGPKLTVRTSSDVLRSSRTWSMLGIGEGIRVPS
jgi:hypothetical protein